MLDKDKLLKSKTFCMLPWTHLHTWPDGRVLTCCMSDSNDAMGNLKEISLEQAWNSPQQKQLRIKTAAFSFHRFCTQQKLTIIIPVGIHVGDRGPWARPRSLGQGPQSLEPVVYFTRQA